MESVQEGVKIAQQLGIPVRAFHFVGAPEPDDPSKHKDGALVLRYQARSRAGVAQPASRDELRAQIDQFLNGEGLRTDEESRLALARC